MFAKVVILSLVASCLTVCSLVEADSRELGIGGLLQLPGIRSSRPKTIIGSVPRTAVYKVRGGSGDSYESDGPARYQFAYQVRAGGPVGKGYDDSREYAGSAYADFGQAEARDGYKTSGKYFVQQPDGRLRTVDYSVDGKSGFIARVSYDGQSDERSAAAGPVVYSKF